MKAREVALSAKLGEVVRALVELSFMDLSHGAWTTWHIGGAMFALWGERGAAAAATLLAPDVEAFHRWRHSPCG